MAGSLVFQQKAARTLAFKILFQRKSLGILKLSESWLVEEENFKAPVLQYLQQVLAFSEKYQQELEQKISFALIDWKMDRLQTGLYAVLIVAGSEMKMMEAKLAPEKLNFAVIANEALEITQKYLGVEAKKICNGVLQKMHDERDKALLLPEQEL